MQRASGDALVISRKEAFILRMTACHTKPFIQPGVVIAPESTPAARAAEHCDYCGSEKLEWRKCKLVCRECRQINKSCADL